MKLKFLAFFYLIAFINLPILAEEDPYKIELQPTPVRFSIVDENGDIQDKYLPPLKAAVGAHGSIKKWQTFYESLDTSAKKGIAGEIVARIFFADRGFNILEEYYRIKLEQLKIEIDPNAPEMYEDQNCTTKKGPDNGIDGLFFSAKGNIVINEAKFRDRASLSPRDFGFVKKGARAHTIQQAHSYWNKDRFDQIDCLKEWSPYSSRDVIRTATLLDRNGNFSLFEIKDKMRTVNSQNTKTLFSSELHGNSGERKAFDRLLVE